MCNSHSFCRVCDKISCNKRIFHTDMSHRDTVANGYRRKYHRHTARFLNTEFYCFRDLIKIHVTGYDLIV